MSSYSFSVAESQTFTVTHARHMAAKVATDLKRVQRFYGAELIVMLKAGYLGEVTYGFKRGNDFIEPTLRYTAGDLVGAGSDDDPGKVRPGKDVTGASFSSYMTYSSKYYSDAAAERESALKDLPFKREGAPTPGVSGYLENDKTYSAGGRALNRASVRSY